MKKSLLFLSLLAASISVSAKTINVEIKDVKVVVHTGNILIAPAKSLEHKRCKGEYLAIPSSASSDIRKVMFAVLFNAYKENQSINIEISDNSCSKRGNWVKIHSVG